VIFYFRFLQANHVGQLARQPVKQLGQADFEGIDIPGGEFQRIIA
jgi:hypothetical protein